MKKIDIGIYSVLGVLSILGAGLLYSVVRGERLPSHQSQTDQGQYEGQIYNLRNDIRLKTPSDISWKDLFSEHGVNFGDQIFVGQGSEATLKTKTFSVHIGENSLFTLTKKNDEPTLALEKGSLELNLTDNNPVAVDVSGKLVRMKGASKILVNRDGQTSDPNLGISVIHGNIKMITPSGRAVPTKTGQSFAIVTDDKKELKFRSMSIEVVKPVADALFFENQKIQFAWNAKVRKFKSVEFELSDSRTFKKIIASEKVKGDSYSVEKLDFGKYFWRIKGDTGSAKVYGPIHTLDVIPDAPAKQQSPMVEFEKPGQWSVQLTAIQSPHSDQYLYEVASDENFQNIISSQKSSGPIAKLPVKYSGNIYTRVRYQYRATDKLSPWSEPYVVTTPSFQEAPFLKVTEPRQGSNYALSWSMVNATKFYRLFQADAETKKILNFSNLKVLAAPLRALTRRESLVWVRSHRSGNEFGFDSNKVVLKGFVDSPRIVEVELEPKWLDRHKEHALPTLKTTVEAGLAGDEELLLEVANNKEMMNSVQTKTKDLKSNWDTPVWEKYFLRVEIVVDREKLFTFPSKIVEFGYPRIKRLRSPLLRLPVQKEHIFNVNKDFFVNFAWTGFDEDVSYDLVISRDADFKNIVHQREVRAREYLLKQFLNDGKYFWKVRSYNKVIESDWSAVRELSIVNAIK